MIELNDKETEAAEIIAKASLDELGGNKLGKSDMGYAGDEFSEGGLKTHEAMQELSGVAYKVMSNDKLKVAAATDKMNDVRTRYGLDSKQYDAAKDKYQEAIEGYSDSKHRYEILKNTKTEVGQALGRGLTF